VRGTCVLDRVGQRLLHDPVGHHIQSRRQSRGLTLKPQLNWQPRGAGLVYERAELRESGYRGARQLVARAAQHTHDPPQLHQRPATRALHHPQCLARCLDVSPRDPPRPARLDHHHAHAVGDHVV